MTLISEKGSLIHLKQKIVLWSCFRLRLSCPNDECGDYGILELLGSTKMYRVSGVTSNHTDLKVYSPTNHLLKHFPLVEL